MPLPELLRRAVYDGELRKLLFNDPERAVAEYHLGEIDRDKLCKLSPADFDAALGKFVAYKLLPTSLGERLTVIPLQGRQVEADTRIPIWLDQSATGANIGAGGTSKSNGRVFGSGTHPTTRLCVHMLERYLEPHMRVLDLGTGSGILALAAARLGAQEVIGLDIDPHAIPIAARNARNNHLEHCVEFAVGDAGWVCRQGIEAFDLVVSNILVEVHLQSLEKGLLEAVRAGGILILSGMNCAGAGEIASRLAGSRCDLIDQARSGNWWALAAKVTQTGRQHSY